MDGHDATRVRARGKDFSAYWDRRRAIVAGTIALTVFTAGVATTGGRGVQAAPVAQGLDVAASDLSLILDQIEIAEHHVASATPQNPCAGLSDPTATKTTAAPAASGLRTVDGSCNNLQPGQQSLGATDQVVGRLTAADFRPAQAGPPDFFGPGTGTLPPSSYVQSSGTVFDDRPRVISNLIVDQSAANPAAADAAPRAPEPGALPSNSLFTVFGQFFGDGLEKIADGNNGSVYVPLRGDDPVIAGADDVVGTADDLPAQLRFMVLSRGTNVPGPGLDGVLGTADD